MSKIKGIKRATREPTVQPQEDGQQVRNPLDLWRNAVQGWHQLNDIQTLLDPFQPDEIDVGRLIVQPLAAGTIGESIRGAAGQSADLEEFTDSTGGTVYAKFDAKGNLLTNETAVVVPMILPLVSSSVTAINTVADIDITGSSASFNFQCNVRLLLIASLRVQIGATAGAGNLQPKFDVNGSSFGTFSYGPPIDALDDEFITLIATPTVGAGACTIKLKAGESNNAQTYSVAAYWAGLALGRF